MSLVKKIGLIGFGNIGSHVGSLAFQSQFIQEIVVFDKNIDRANGDIIDIENSFSSNAKMYTSEDYQSLENSDVIVVTAGMRRQKDQTREDLFEANKQIIDSIAIQIKKYAPEAFVIVVTNPLDSMVYEYFKSSGISRYKLCGMSSSLDTRRFEILLAKNLGISSNDVSAKIIGQHNDNMLLLKEEIKINNIGYQELLKNEMLTEDIVHNIFNESKTLGAKINNLRSGLSAYFAPAQKVFEIIQALNDTEPKKILASVVLDGEYGKYNLARGTEVQLCSKKIIQIKEFSYNYIKELI